MTTGRTPTATHLAGLGPGLWRSGPWRHGLLVVALLAGALLACASCRRPAAAPAPGVAATAGPAAIPLAGAATATLGLPAVVARPVVTLPHLPQLAPEPADDGAPAEPGVVGRFGDDGSTAGRSVGTAQNGSLVGGEMLRDSAVLRVLPHTRQRGFVHGTAELVGLLSRAAEAVAAEHPGSVLRVGNLSRAGGGDIPPSVSHNSGRDADVAFFAFERLGGRAEPGSFVRFDDVGLADGGRFEFDTARNWTLVRRWLSDPEVVVQWIFVSVPLRNRLLDYALRQGEPESLRLRAQRVLVQPRDSSPHADHFHLRIACPARDRPGCVDGAGRTALAREAQVDALLEMYRAGSPAEQRYARELLTLPTDGEDLELPPIEGED